MRTIPNDHSEPDSSGGARGDGESRTGSGGGPVPVGASAPARAGTADETGADEQAGAAETGEPEETRPENIADEDATPENVAAEEFPPEDVAPEVVIARLDEDFGLALTALAETGGGADEAALLWHGTTPGGDAYAVRLDGGTAAGLLVPAELARQHVPGVPAPLPTRDGRPWSELGGRRLSVLPWLDGESALDGELDADDWRAYGETLARVHATVVPTDLGQHVPDVAYPDEPLLATVRAVEARLARPADELAVEAAAEWRAAAGALDRLLHGASELARRAADRPAPPLVVSHGDPHQGNVLRGTGGARLWLTGWDDAVLAPREWDLMFVLDGGVLPFAPVTEEQQAWFLEGYGPVEIDPERLARARVSRALEDLTFPAAQATDADQWELIERTEALTLLRWVLSPTGLVRVAVESLDDLGIVPSPADGSAG